MQKHKFFKLNAAERRRLVELAKARSGDEMVNDEKTAEERDAEIRRRLLELAAKEFSAGDQGPPAAGELDAGLDANWDAIKARLGQTAQAPAAGHVLPLPSKARRWPKTLTFASLAAVAAAAAVMIQVGRPGRTGDDSLLQPKGAGGGEVQAWRCETEPRLQSGPLTSNDGGQTYQVTSGETVLLAVRCAEAVFVQLRVTNAAGETVAERRNFQLAAGAKSIVGETTAAPAGLHVQVAATLAAMAEDAAFPAGGKDVWADDFILKGTP